MKVKQKVCAGWGNQKPHLAFIWKRIKGIPYCKACTYRLQGVWDISLIGKKSTIKKISEKQKIKNQEKKVQTKLRFEMFLNIWNKLKNKNCWSCNKYLGEEPSPAFFDHLIEKSKYPELDLVEENIFICCENCHANKTNGHPSLIHMEAIKQAKIKLL